MIRFLLRRVLWGMAIVWFVATLVFAMFFVAPRDVARLIAGRQASDQTLEVVRKRLGLDQPVPVQYVRFLGRLVRGDLGESFLTSEPVVNVIRRGFPVTASLALGAATLWLIIGVGTGVIAATRPRSLFDRALTGVALFFYSMPPFLLGELLLLFLFFRLYMAGYSFFPPGAYVPLTESAAQWARHLILPWLSIALITAATYSRLTRGAMLDVLGEDYIRTARAKGLTEGRIVYKHALRSSAAPVMTQFGIDLGGLLGGAIVTEVVFGLPGLGREAVLAITTQDLPVIIGITILSSMLVVVANLVVDMCYALLDPRVRVR
ncbi:MAG TPA: ABC transporter permease [Terriglobia bacterium]|nr:ABC transporter permease [Terriglobia bacterium]